MFFNYNIFRFSIGLFGATAPTNVIPLLKRHCHGVIPTRAVGVFPCIPHISIDFFGKGFVCANKEFLQCETSEITILAVGLNIVMHKM
jgi:hypothetical protein